MRQTRNNPLPNRLMTDWEIKNGIGDNRICLYANAAACRN